MPAESRCPLTELLPDQCGCRNHRNCPDIEPDLPGTAAATGRVNEFTARHNSTCELCDGRIRVGDRCAYTGRGIACPSCLDDMAGLLL